LKKLKVVELFSGIGAWSKALENLHIPHKVVLAVDNDKYPITAYNAIHNANFESIDISELDEKSVPDCDVICYSPPCQSFSAAGKQLGFEDKRGILFFDALRIIKEKKPQYALMENVKGLAQKKFAKEFETMLDELEKAGYTNYVPNRKVLNAKDYNVAQNRERLFVVSIRNDVEQTFKFPVESKLNKKIIDYLEEDAQSPILHNIYGGFKETTTRTFEEYSPTIRTSAGGGHIPSVIIKGCSLRTRSYMGQPQKLEIRKDELSNTVTTVPKDFMIAIVDDTYKGRDLRMYTEYCPTIRSGRKGFKIVAKVGDTYSLVKDSSDIVDDGDYFFIREMSTLEAFRFMGFEDEDYNKARQALNDTYYKGKDKSQTRLYKLAGNSIVVDVCEAIFKELLPEYISE
jgi:DNA (cytosine-5)-methyltransferase 1